ncbi:MAG: hypothetical protein A3F18_08255 [Legionellales bacterium RIFCSPHIGHO2_12_FULL_37_14]|nr:MAG: hypothetical protein A3F18_08255 [Legionellales bacterium RIFCSPHIGHO2_12_FULL_37_14]
MILLRSVRASDYPSLKKLILNSDLTGITTLALDEKSLKTRLDKALHSFQNPDPNKHCYYWFILEDTYTQEVLGVSAIATQIGKKHNFYAFERIPYTNNCKTLGIKHSGEMLKLTLKLKTATELCSLFMHPDKRKLGHGSFLSCARFLFLGAFTEYFAPTIIAELRGVTDEHRSTPFWNALGKHFFHMEFLEADRLSNVTDKKFIAKLMPKNPFYVCMLPKKAQQVIDKPHVNSIPAMNILLKEGFRLSEFIDIFDAGPILKTKVHKIKTIKAMKSLTVLLKDDLVNPQDAWVSNTNFANFSVIKCKIMLNQTNDKVILPQECASLLRVKEKAKVNVVVRDLE